MERYLADQRRTLASEMAEVRRAADQQRRLRGGEAAASRDVSRAQRTRMQVLHGSPGRRRSEPRPQGVQQNRPEHYGAGMRPERNEVRVSPGRGKSSVSQQRVPGHRPGRYRSASSPGRRRTDSSGRSKATSPRRVGAYPDPYADVQRNNGSFGDANRPSAVSVPLVEDGPPTTARRRRGWHRQQHSRTPASAQSSDVEATRASWLKHESARLARTKAEFDAMWDDMQDEAAVLVQKHYRGYRGRQLALQEEEQMWREQEDEEQAAMREELRWQQQQQRRRQEEQEHQAERMRRAEVQREHTEEQRRIMDQRRRVREEAAEVEREFAHLQQVKLVAEQQALAAERQMLLQQRQKLAAAKQQNVRPSLKTTEYRPMGDLTLELAHSVETATENGAWPPTEGVPPSSPAVESRIASLEQQFSQMTDLLTSSRSSPQHPLQHRQHDDRRQQMNKRGTAVKVGSNLYTVPPQSARAPEPEPEPELQPVRASAPTYSQRQHHPQGVSGESQLKRQQKEEQAAVLLQKTYRGYRGRQCADEYYEQLLSEQQQEDEAATKLQAAWRGSSTRKEMALMQDESPREKAWALFGGSGRGGSYAAQQAVSPRTQLARRNQFLRVGNSAGGSVLVGTTSQNDMVRSTHSSNRYRSSAIGAGSLTSESTLGTVCPEDLFADADIAGDGVLMASQVREVLVAAAPVLGRRAPPSDERFVSNLLQAFGKRYRLADGSLPTTEVVVGLDIDAFCAMWDHITGSDTQHYDRAGYDSDSSTAQMTTNSSYYSETEEEDAYDSHDFRDHSQVGTDNGAIELGVHEAAATLSMPTRAAVSGTDQIVASHAPEEFPVEKNAAVAAAAGNSVESVESGTGDSNLQALMEEGAAISIQAKWRGRRTVNALSELRSMGMTDADIRWMIQQGHHLPG